MLSHYFNITVIAEWITFIVSINLLDKKTKAWRMFILYMLLIIITETIGWYLTWKLHEYGNALPFNINMLIDISFMIWFFTKVKYLNKIKRQLLYLDYFFIFFGLVNLFFFHGFWAYNYYTETLGDIMLSIICCYFFYTLLTDREYVDLLRLDYFWLATGVLFSSLGSAVLYQFSGALMEYYLKTKIALGMYINYALNLLLYTSLIIAFICRWKTTR